MFHLIGVNFFTFNNHEKTKSCAMSNHSYRLMFNGIDRWFYAFSRNFQPPHCFVSGISDIRLKTSEKHFLWEPPATAFIVRVLVMMLQRRLPHLLDLLPYQDDHGSWAMFWSRLLEGGIWFWSVCTIFHRSHDSQPYHQDLSARDILRFGLPPEIKVKTKVI